MKGKKFDAVNMMRSIRDKLNEQYVNDPTRFAVELERINKKYHIKKMSLFGSVIHDDVRSDSDIDILVEFLPGHTPGFAFARIQEELSALLHRPVDLHTPSSLSRYFRGAVLREARALYAQH